MLLYHCKKRKEEEEENNEGNNFWSKKGKGNGTKPGRFSNANVSLRVDPGKTYIICQGYNVIFKVLSGLPSILHSCKY